MDQHRVLIDLQQGLVTEQQLFSPFANLFSLMGSKSKFPLIHRIVTLLGILPIGKALGALERLQAMTNGTINHDHFHQPLKKIHPDVDKFIRENRISQSIKGREFRPAIGTVKRLLGTRFTLRNPTNLLDNNFLRPKGFELCYPADAWFVPEQILGTYLTTPNSSVLAIGTAPIGQHGKVLVWRKRRISESNDSTAYYRLELEDLSRLVDSQFTMWLFAIDETSQII